MCGSLGSPSKPGIQWSVGQVGNPGYLWQSLTTDCLRISCNLLEVLGYPWRMIWCSFDWYIAPRWNNLSVSGQQELGLARSKTQDKLDSLHSYFKNVQQTHNELPITASWSWKQNKIKSNIVQLTWTLSPSTWCTVKTCFSFMFFVEYISTALALH